MEIKYLTLFVIFYLIGSIPFAFILTKLCGLGDIRNVGSGNVGSTNVLRTGNKTLALLILILDICKGLIPLIVMKNYYDIYNANLILIIIGGMTILGHIFPIWLRFKGGKGVATYIGFLLALDYILGSFFIFIWIILALLKRYSSLSSIISLMIIPLTSFIILEEINISYFLIGISFLIIFMHKSNIMRLFNKTESKIKF
jgi:glycerol-3-phosphate acyltransferase PlsY